MLLQVSLSRFCSCSCSRKLHGVNVAWKTNPQVMRSGLVQRVVDFVGWNWGRWFNNRELLRLSIGPLLDEVRGLWVHGHAGKEAGYGWRWGLTIFCLYKICWRLSKITREQTGGFRKSEGHHSQGRSNHCRGQDPFEPCASWTNTSKCHLLANSLLGKFFRKYLF